MVKNVKSGGRITRWSGGRSQNILEAEREMFLILPVI